MTLNAKGDHNGLLRPITKDISNEMASKFKIANTWNNNMSGGEKRDLN